MEEDAAGYLWISSHAGIMRVSKPDLNSCADGTTNMVSCVTYGKGEGMPTLECMGGMQPSGCRTVDGRLWIPTTKGLVSLDPSEVRKNTLVPRVLIEEFRVDGKSATGGGSSTIPVSGSGNASERLDVPPGQHQFDVQFTALSFTVPEKVRFKCMLEGLNKDWVDVGGKRSINYPYLPPDAYIFRVIACNNDDVWNTEGAALAFRVLPEFWQTWWFKACVGGAAAVAIGTSVLLVTRRRMKVKLERLEHQRAVERERTRIARDIHDDLGASLTRITMLSQSARAELDHSAAATDLDRIYDTARELTRAMDEIVWAVNPQHDTLDSLATYLGRFAQGFLAAAHIPCRLDVPMQLPGWPLTAEIRHNLFLAFKEALNNAVKHSKTDEVRISITIESGGFTLQVEDKGCGFLANAPERPSVDLAQPSPGNGLTNMRQRLAEIGGRCEIKSAPGNGTTIAFVVPVKIATP
jgi:signal transduction histidine kinase